MITYRITHGLVDIPASQYLHPATVMHIRGPSQRYMIPFCSTDVYRHSFFPTGIRLWNQLSEHGATAKAGGPSRPLLASYRSTLFYPFLSVLTATGVPHSTLVHSSMCDDAPERTLHTNRKEKNSHSCGSLKLSICLFFSNFPNDYKCFIFCLN